MKNIKIILLIIVILFFAGFGYFVLLKNKPFQGQLQPLIILGPQVNDEGGVSIEVTPIDFSLSKPVQLKITFNTHQGNLDFDLTKISYLLDDKNNKYIPVSWEGGSGGHHLSGVLVFPAINKDAKTMKFVIENVYNAEKREFFWEIE